MSSPFAAPAAPSSGVKWQDLNRRLVLIEPQAVEAEVETAYGQTEAVRADIAVLDGDNKGEVYSDALIFPRLLVSQTRSKIGAKILARVTQGTAKPGQSPPWILGEASADDQQTGVKYLEYREKQQLSQPAPAEAAPQPQQGGEVPF